MSKPAIRSYEELIAYRDNLQELLHLQKQLIIYDIEEIKEKVNPVVHIAANAAKLFIPSGDASPLTRITGKLIDVILRRIILRKAGWISKAVVPFLVHNISSHLIAGNKESLTRKLSLLFSGKRKK